MPSIADTSRGSLRYVEEITPGVTPASALTGLRFTGESLNKNKTTETSNEIRADRQITDLIDTDSDASGDINFELSYAALDDFLPGALLADDWEAQVTISEIDLEAVAADNSYNSVTVDFTTEGLFVGMWVKPAGFSNADNNDYCQVVSIATSKLIVSGSTLINESGVTGTIVNGGMLRNGVTQHSYSIEKEFADIGQFASFAGMEVDTFSLDIASNAIVTGTMGFMGRTAGNGQATIGTGAPLEAPTNDVYNATSNMASIREAGVALSSATFFATAISTSVANGLRGQKAVSVEGSVGIGKGRCEVTGSLSAYFVNEVLLEKFLNNTATSLDYRLTDEAGNTYIVTMPEVKYSSATTDLSGIDADVLIPLDYQALRDPVLGFTIQVDRFAA